MYRIFIIEDDPTIAQTLKNHLEGWDYKVECAKDFHNITAEFAAFDPQLVLLDIKLLVRRDKKAVKSAGHLPLLSLRQYECSYGYEYGRR